MKKLTLIIMTLFVMNVFAEETQTECLFMKESTERNNPKAASANTVKTSIKKPDVVRN